MRGSQLSAPSTDENAWYYPSHGHESDDEPLPAGPAHGNWGKKKVRGARWVRKGKIAPWGPGIEEWDVRFFHSLLHTRPLTSPQAEERARKRIKILLPPSRSPSPPALPHLRSPSPPLVGPYPDPRAEHLSYTSLVMDKGITHTFRSGLLDDLERVTDGFVEAEGALRRALGRLWAAMNTEPPPEREPEAGDDVKEEQQDEAMADADAEEDDGELERERRRRLARAPDLLPATHKIFLTPPGAQGIPPSADGEALEGEAEMSGAPLEVQEETMVKSLATLRELLDDGREYVERLGEIRNGIGEMKSQRDVVWDVVRTNAIKELEGAALGTGI